MTKPLAAPAILRGLEQNNIAVFIFRAYRETLAGEPVILSQAARN
jgi:alpha-D-ribose 1-methylphosphonate 5-triphosphate synthase subunit PhnI